MLMRLLGVIIGIVFVIWAITSPADAGISVHHWISGLVSFFSHLASG